MNNSRDYTSASANEIALGAAYYWDSSTIIIYTDGSWWKCNNISSVLLDKLKSRQNCSDADCVPLVAHKESGTSVRKLRRRKKWRWWWPVVPI
jgi:hypothetical protein